METIGHLREEAPPTHTKNKDALLEEEFPTLLNPITLKKA